MTVSRPAKSPRPRGSAAGPRRRRAAAAGARLPGIRPTALPAKGGADWYRRGVFYEVLTRGFFDSNDDGIGDLAGLRAKLDYLEWLGVDCLVAVALLPLAHARRRLRHQRLLHRPRRSRAPRRPGGVPRRRPPARHQGDRRSRHEPHQRPTPVVRRVAVVAGQPQGRLVRLERRRPALARGPGGLRGRGDVATGPGTRPGSSTTGTASTRTSPISTTRTPKWSKPCSAWCGSGSTSASTGSASTPSPTCSSGTGPRARTFPRPTRCSASCARRWTPRIPTGCCWPRPTSGPRTSSTTSATATSATCASTSPSCRACSWPCAASNGSPSPRSWPRPRRSPRTVSGPSSCATTTSSRSRR